MASMHGCWRPTASPSPMLHCAGARLRAARLTTAAKASAASSCAPESAVADAAGLHVPAYTIWGANTDVGKTLVSAGLCRAVVHSNVGTLALIPSDVARMLALQASRSADAMCARLSRAVTRDFAHSTCCFDVRVWSPPASRGNGRVGCW